MTKRVIIFLAVAAAAVVLTFLLWPDSGEKGAGPGGDAQQPVKKRGTGGGDLWLKLARQASDPATAAAVSLDFKETPLPEVLNQLVKQAGLTVTADLEKSHEQKAVTLQAFLTPLEGLKLISREYGLELEETKDGWWLRPVPPKVEVIYQPTLLAMDEGRVQRLLQSLREIVEAVDREGNALPNPNGAEVNLKPDGLHVFASKEIQKEVRDYLEELLKEKIPSRSAEGKVEGIPALPRR